MYAEFMKNATALLVLIFLSAPAAALDLTGKWFGNGYYKNSVLGSHSSQVYMEFNQTPGILAMSVCWKFVKTPSEAIWTICTRWNFEVIGNELRWYGEPVGTVGKSGFEFAYGDGEAVFTRGRAILQESGRLDYFYEDRDSAGRETRSFVEGMKSLN
jgi:hypothetical protein